MRKYKVLMLGTIFPDTQLEEEILKEIGAELILIPNADEGTLMPHLPDADAIVTTYVQVTEKMLDATKRCRVVVRTGIGVDAIDVPAATRRGIFVANVPDYCYDEVSDHTLALALALQRKITTLSQKAKRKKWELSEAKPMLALRNQIYGLVGFGNIARLVAKKRRRLA